MSYVAELRKLATHCNFGGNLNEALRDRLVCGLRNMQIQKRLLSEAKLKYSKAVEIAVAMETAIRDASELLSELNPDPVLHVDKLTEHNKPTPAKPATTLVRYRCGWNTHTTHNCFYKEQICHHCEKQGHIQRVCRSKQQGKPKQATKTPEVHTVEVDVDVDVYENILATFEVHNVRKQSNEIIWVDLDVDDKPLKVELDTGSAVSIISFDLYQQKFNRLPLHKTGLSLKTYTGETLCQWECSKYPWITKTKERCWTCMSSRIRLH